MNVIMEDEDKDKKVGDKSTNGQEKELTPYEQYCKEQFEAYEDEVGDDRCFPDMPEGQFVRGH